VVIEVSNTSLDTDREDKSRIYARAGLPVYWIVNVVDRQVEVYEQPSGPTADPGYATRTDYKPGDSVPLVLDGNTVGTIPAADLLP
jgi:Uma2 family endonuclease